MGARLYVAPKKAPTSVLKPKGARLLQRRASDQLDPETASLANQEQLSTPDQANQTSSSFAPSLRGHSFGRMAVWPGAQKSNPTLQRQSAPAAPGLTDAQQWDQDWTNYAAQQHYFAGNDRPAGTRRQRYDVLCPLYKAHGIPRPMVYMATSITTAKFYHFSTPAHSNLAMALAAAEAALKGKGYSSAPVKSVWALNSRTTSKGTWSNHADGKAVDIDPNDNPHLIDRKERQIITLMTGVEIDKGGQGYNVLKGASDKFKTDYNLTGMQQRLTQLNATEKTKTTERDTVKTEHATSKGQQDMLKLEHAALKQQLKRVSQGKKASVADIATATALKAIIQQKDIALAQVQKEIKQKQTELKKKEADLKATTKDRVLIEQQLATYQATDKAISDLENALLPLPAEIMTLENQVTQSKLNEQTAKANKDPAGVKIEQKLQATLKQALKQKQAALTKQQTQLDKKRKQRDTNPLHQYAAGGFLNLSKDVVDALTGAGLTWGGNWAGAKDFMHFEL